MFLEVPINEYLNIEKFDIFMKDMFVNISNDPEFYRNNSDYLFNEYFSTSDHKGAPEKYIEVEDELIKIVYYPHDRSINGKYIIQFVTLKKGNNNYFLAEYFERSPEEIVLSISNKPENWSERVGNFYLWSYDGIYQEITKAPKNWNGEIFYIAEGNSHYVRFTFKNRMVCEINYGECY